MGKLAISAKPTGIVLIEILVRIARKQMNVFASTKTKPIAHLLLKGSTVLNATVKIRKNARMDFAIANLASVEKLVMKHTMGEY